MLTDFLLLLLHLSGWLREGDFNFLQVVDLQVRDRLVACHLAVSRTFNCYVRVS